MTTTPFLALLNLGGGQILLILLLLLLSGLGVIAVVIVLVIASGRKPVSRPAPVSGIPPTLSAPPQELESQLRMLAGLNKDGILTDAEFTAKKKALLGL